VTFDIDANGILHVSAKDLGTGKEQSIKITASSGLTEEEIKRMIKDAEEHAAEDAAKREEIALRNQADALVYSTERTLKELGDKIDSADKIAIEDAIRDLKKAIESGTKEEVKAGIDRLNSVSHKLSEHLYRHATAGAGATSGATGGTSSATGASSASSSSDGPEIVEGEIVDDNK
jgi:molecular chaperone DnaK